MKWRKTSFQETVSNLCCSCAAPDNLQYALPRKTPKALIQTTSLNHLWETWTHLRPSIWWYILCKAAMMRNFLKSQLKGCSSHQFQHLFIHFHEQHTRVCQQTRLYLVISERSVSAQPQLLAQLLGLRPKCLDENTRLWEVNKTALSPTPGSEIALLKFERFCTTTYSLILPQNQTNQTYLLNKYLYS